MYLFTNLFIYFSIYLFIFHVNQLKYVDIHLLTANFIQVKYILFLIQAQLAQTHLQLKFSNNK